MRKIFIVTERRADYSRFKPILELIAKDPFLQYYLVVTGIHMKHEHGLTIDEIKNDGFRVSSTFEMFKENEDSGASMTRALGTAIQQITYELEKAQPDIILSGFDIAANFAATIAGAHMNIPVAHIQGGEVTGTIDESIRHATSKFAHYHFAANEDARQRLIKMGELAHCVFNVGCPSIDAIKKVKILPKQHILQKYNLKDPFIVMLQHPVTSEIKDSGEQIKETIQALIEFGISSIIIHPNNDAGYSLIVEHIEKANIQTIKTVTLSDYVNLLNYSSALVGNSSSGIHETATFDIPTINIGTRQNGRLRPTNVIDVGYNKPQILMALKQCFDSGFINKRCKNCKNPYGDGRSAQKIVSLLKEIDISEKIIQKRISY